MSERSDPKSGGQMPPANEENESQLDKALRKDPELLAFAARLSRHLKELDPEPLIKEAKRANEKAGRTKKKRRQAMRVSGAAIALAGCALLLVFTSRLRGNERPSVGKAGSGYSNDIASLKMWRPEFGSQIEAWLRPGHALGPADDHASVSVLKSPVNTFLADRPSAFKWLPSNGSFFRFELQSLSYRTTDVARALFIRLKADKWKVVEFLGDNKQPANATVQSGADWDPWLGGKLSGLARAQDYRWRVEEVSSAGIDAPLIQGSDAEANFQILSKVDYAAFRARMKSATRPEELYQAFYEFGLIQQAGDEIKAFRDPMAASAATKKLRDLGFEP